MASSRAFRILATALIPARITTAQAAMSNVRTNDAVKGRFEVGMR
jgi:hypothetical protein